MKSVSKSHLLTSDVWLHKQLSKSSCKRFAKHNAQILNYSKEDTILIYEQRAINDAFGSFADFQNAVGSLYVDYVSSLVAEQGGE
ncbi:MAG TPA: hypothetical protein DEB75_08120 [Weissella confusa]|nr:hypothetical protein [Weissella confusa]